MPVVEDLRLNPAVDFCFKEINRSVGYEAIAYTLPFLENMRKEEMNSFTGQFAEAMGLPELAEVTCDDDELPVTKNRYTMRTLQITMKGLKKQVKLCERIQLQSITGAHDFLRSSGLVAAEFRDSIFMTILRRVRKALTRDKVVITSGAQTQMLDPQQDGVVKTTLTDMNQFNASLLMNLVEETVSRRGMRGGGVLHLFVPMNLNYLLFKDAAGNNMCCSLQEHIIKYKHISQSVYAYAYEILGITVYMYLHLPPSILEDPDNKDNYSVIGFFENRMMMGYIPTDRYIDEQCHKDMMGSSLVTSYSDSIFYMGAYKNCQDPLFPQNYYAMSIFDFVRAEYGAGFEIIVPKALAKGKIIASGYTLANGPTIVTPSALTPPSDACCETVTTAKVTTKR